MDQCFLGQKHPTESKKKLCSGKRNQIKEDVKNFFKYIETI